MKNIKLEYEYKTNDNNYIIVYDKETKEELLLLRIAFGGCVYSGYVIYKGREKNKQNHLNLTGFLPQNIDKYISIAIDNEYIYVQYLRLAGPSYLRHTVCTMRKYKYK